MHRPDGGKCRHFLWSEMPSVWDIGYVWNYPMSVWDIGYVCVGYRIVPTEKVTNFRNPSPAFRPPFKSLSHQCLHVSGIRFTCECNKAGNTHKYTSTPDSAHAGFDHAEGLLRMWAPTCTLPCERFAYPERDQSWHVAMLMQL